MEVVVEQVAGRAPVVIGTQGLSTPHAQMFSRHANAVGADAVIAMAPYVQALLDEDAVVDYYQGISDVVDVPVFIQNHARGSVLSAKLMARIVQQAEHVEYIKEETFPVTHMVTQAIELCGPKLKGVFGGAGGRYMLLEYPRGVAGQMPGCHVTDVMVRFWNALDGGDLAEAKRIYGLLAPLYALETVKGASYPEVLRRRGVIDAVYSRSTTVSPHGRLRPPRPGRHPARPGAADDLARGRADPLQRRRGRRRGRPPPMSAWRGSDSAVSTTLIRLADRSEPESCDACRHTRASAGNSRVLGDDQTASMQCIWLSIHSIQLNKENTSVSIKQRTPRTRDRPQQPVGRHLSRPHPRDGLHRL